MQMTAVSSSNTCQERPCLLDGDETNMKLTTIQDLYILDKLFQLRSERAGARTSLNALRGQ